MNNKFEHEYDTKYFEKNLGLTPADLLILEIKKPNKPIFQKTDIIVRKNTNKNKKGSISLDEPIYKDPKVR